MKFLKKLRGGESYRDLADKTGISHTSVWNYETKDSPIINRFLMFICKLRNVVGMSWEEYGKLLDKETKQ